MRIVRALVLVLVLLNLLLFAAGRGYLGRSDSGEPERLAHQITPERIRIVEGGQPDPSPETAQPASPASQAQSAPAAKNESDAKLPPKPDAQAADQSESRTEPKADTARDLDVCRRYAPLSRDQAARITAYARAHDAHVKASQKSLAEPVSYWVFIPPSTDAQDMDKHVEELKRAGIRDWFVQPDGPDKGGISLGVFKTEAMATVQEEQLRAKGITGMRVLGRDSASAKYAVELTARTGELDALAQQIGAAVPGVDGQACVQ